MEKDKLRKAATELSVKLIHLYDQIERRSFLKNQLARAGTGIGANLHEAHYAESADDFVHKLRIALKECYECEYWLTLLEESCPEQADVAVALRNEAGSIRRMLIASVNTCLKSSGKK